MEDIDVLPVEQLEAHQREIQNLQFRLGRAVRDVEEARDEKNHLVVNMRVRRLGPLLETFNKLQGHMESAIQGTVPSNASTPMRGVSQSPGRSDDDGETAQFYRSRLPSTYQQLRQDAVTAEAILREAAEQTGSPLPLATVGKAPTRHDEATSTLVFDDVGGGGRALPPPTVEVVQGSAAPPVAAATPSLEKKAAASPLPPTSRNGTGAAHTAEEQVVDDIKGAIQQMKQGALNISELMSKEKPSLEATAALLTSGVAKSQENIRDIGKVHGVDDCGAANGGVPWLFRRAPGGALVWRTVVAPLWAVVKHALLALSIIAVTGTVLLLILSSRKPVKLRGRRPAGFAAQQPTAPPPVHEVASESAPRTADMGAPEQQQQPLADDEVQVDQPREDEVLHTFDNDLDSRIVQEQGVESQEPPTPEVRDEPIVADAPPAEHREESDAHGEAPAAEEGQMHPADETPQPVTEEHPPQVEQREDDAHWEASPGQGDYEEHTAHDAQEPIVAEHHHPPQQEPQEGDQWHDEHPAQEIQPPVTEHSEEHMAEEAPPPAVEEHHPEAADPRREEGGDEFVGEHAEHVAQDDQRPADVEHGNANWETPAEEQRPQDHHEYHEEPHQGEPQQEHEQVPDDVVVVENVANQHNVQEEATAFENAAEEVHHQPHSLEENDAHGEPDTIDEQQQQQQDYGHVQEEAEVPVPEEHLVHEGIQQDDHHATEGVPEEHGAQDEHHADGGEGTHVEEAVPPPDPAPEPVADEPQEGEGGGAMDATGHAQFHEGNPDTISPPDAGEGMHTNHEGSPIDDGAAESDL